MKIPHAPPRLDEILDRLETGKLTAIIHRGQQLATEPGYDHWDRFRRRIPPYPGLTSEEQWIGLKLSRLNRQQNLPLVDRDSGQPFHFFLTQESFEKVHRIDQQGAGVISASDALINEPERDRFYLTSLIEEALTSSQIEGAAVTRAEASEMVRQGRKPGNSHEWMVYNNFLTMRSLADWKKEDLSLDLIRRIHRQITGGTLDRAEDEGRLRTDADRVRVEDGESGEILHTPPPASGLEASLAAMCQFANQRHMEGFLHPVIRSIILHFWLAWEHPFVDGNGRTARALFYWSMLRQGYWLAEFLSISHEILKAPKQYYRAFLHVETDERDLNYFILHQLEMICRSIEALDHYVSRKRREIKELEQRLGPAAGFNHRQLALLRRALKQPQDNYTYASHQRSHGIVRQTARTDLIELVGRGLLETWQEGRTHRFRPHPDLARRLMH